MPIVVARWRLELSRQWTCNNGVCSNLVAYRLIKIQCVLFTRKKTDPVPRCGYVTTRTSYPASAFRFVSSTVYSPYPTLNLWQPSFSSHRCTDLEQSSAAYHICSVTSRLLISLKDILFQSLLPVITVVVLAK